MKSKARYQVIIAYDGTGFAGFQRQARARTVQAVIETALREVGWQGTSLLSAGRTDTGVHAAGQVIAFDLDWNHSPLDLKHALNASLPPDVAAHEVKVAAEDFHPRYDALWRCYHYRLFFQDTRDPLRERYAWRVWPPGEPALLDRAAGLLAGRHDFVAFGNPPRHGGSTIRTVFQSGWKKENTGMVFQITADAFLYHMVRHLVAIQAEMAQGKQTIEQLAVYLENGSAGKVRALAPAQGLILMEVHYPDLSGSAETETGLNDVQMEEKS